MGLKTTATYIKETDEFEFNTPTPDACKWWVGQLVCFIFFPYFLLP